MFRTKWSLRCYQTLVNSTHHILSYHQNTKWLVTFCEVYIYIMHNSRTDDATRCPRFVLSMLLEFASYCVLHFNMFAFEQVLYNYHIKIIHPYTGWPREKKTERHTSHSIWMQ